MRHFRAPFAGVCFLAVTVVPVPAAGQTPAADTAARTSSPALRSRATIEAAPLTGALRIDGRLDEEAWALATPYSDFIQRDPEEGQPASEKTEIRVLVGPDALYIGARMYDREPRRIRARLGRRDEAIEGADLFEVYIDSFHDRLTGYLFRVTAAGAVTDAVVTSGGAQDNSWDAVWDSGVTIDSLGWSAELKIPFSQIRYDARLADQMWGIQFGRVIARKAETAFLPFAPKSVAVTPATWADLTGLGRLPPTRHLEILPYVTARAEYLTRTPGNPFRDGRQMRMKTGLDVRYGLSSSFTLSGAVNPDFGQVEVDPARVNLTENELFFPERRPLFVEGADIFRFAQSRSYNYTGFPLVFHSRRIGRAPQRMVSGLYPYVDAAEEATIMGAAKLAGKTAGGLSLGLLDAVTRREVARFQNTALVQGEEPVEPMTNYLVGRVRRDSRTGNTSFGGIVTAVNRDLADSALAALLRHDAYFAGLDFSQAWKQREWVLDAAAGGTYVTGSPSAISLTQASPVHYFQRPDRKSYRFDPTRRSLSGTVWQLSGAKRSGVHWLGSIALQGTTPGFEANDLGFQPTAGYRWLQTATVYKEDKPGRIVRNHITGIGTDRTWNADGDRINDLYFFLSQGQLRNFWPVRVKIRYMPGSLDDRLTRGGPLSRQPWVRTFEGGFSTDPRKVYVLTAFASTQVDGGPGWQDIYSGGVSVRPNPAFRLTLTPEWVSNRNAAQFLTSAADSTAVATYGRRYLFGSLRFTQLSLITRVDWTFSPRLSLQMFAQPLVASGVFSEIKSLALPRTFTFDRYSEAGGSLSRDSTGAFTVLTRGGTAIRIRNPDFNTRSLVGNAVVRWEYRPGSTLFFVWQQRRSELERLRDFSFSRDAGAVFSQRPENIFAIKATYWLAR